MDFLVIYDETGYIISVTGTTMEPRKLVGVPSLLVEIPLGKQIKITNGIGVDVSITPHQVILEDVPPTEVDTLKQQVTELQDALVEIADMVAGGVA